MAFLESYGVWQPAKPVAKRTDRELDQDFTVHGGMVMN